MIRKSLEWLIILLSIPVVLCLLLASCIAFTVLQPELRTGRKDSL